MDKKTQDLTWKCLPKEARDEIKANFIGLNTVLNTILSKEALSNEECDRVKAIKEKKSIYEMYFGEHNLTSDTEPEEILMAKASDVRDIYSYNEIILQFDSNHNAAIVLKNTMKALFGDKCLPNKTPKEIAAEIVDTIKDSTEKPIQMPETMLNPQTSVQVKPKFYSEITTREEFYDPKSQTITEVITTPGKMHLQYNVCDLKKSYTEPETKEKD